MEIIEIDTIDDLDNYLHEQVISRMKAEECGLEIIPKEPVKLVLSQEILNIGIEVVNEILMMKLIERALNDPYVKNYKGSTDKVHDSVTYENTILPILSGNKEIIYH